MNDSAVAMHQIEVHGTLDPDYKSRIKYVHRENLTRMTHEALHILSNSGENILNRRGEFGKMVLRRMDIREMGPYKKRRMGTSKDHGGTIREDPGGTIPVDPNGTTRED